MAVRGGFSSALITAHRRWWKDVLMLWRRCVVFGLSFDYIPNYSASKQLNEARLWRADQRRRFAFYAPRRSPFVLARVGGRERGTSDEGGEGSPGTEASLDYKGQWYHNDITIGPTLMSPWCHDLSAGLRVLVCARWGEKRAGVEEERFSQT